MVSKMFWAMKLEPNKGYSQKMIHELHISAAVLNVESMDKKAKTNVQIWISQLVDGEKADYLIANLCRSVTQVALDISIDQGETVSLYTNGCQGDVYLHGYFLNDVTSQNQETELNLTNNDLQTDSKQDVEIFSQENNGESEIDEHDGDSESGGSGGGESESDRFGNEESTSNQETTHKMMEYANYFMQPNNPTGQFVFTSPAHSIQSNQFVPMSNIIQLPVQSIAKNGKNKKEKVKNHRTAPYQMMLQNQAQPMVQAQAQSMMLSGQNVKFVVRQPKASAQKGSKLIKVSNQRRKN